MRGIPFKFNRMWLQEDFFISLVWEIWSSRDFKGITYAMDLLSKKVHILKREVCKWEQVQKDKMKKLNLVSLLAHQPLNLLDPRDPL